MARSISQSLAKLRLEWTLLLFWIRRHQALDDAGFDDPVQRDTGHYIDLHFSDACHPVLPSSVAMRESARVGYSYPL